MTTQFVPDALEQALWQRKPLGNRSLTHHSDRGSQDLSLKYTERLADADVDPSVGSVGDSYDNALAESVIGLFKAEVIRRLGPCKTMQAVEWETMRRVHWYNTERLLGSIGYVPLPRPSGGILIRRTRWTRSHDALNETASGQAGACVDSPCLASMIFSGRRGLRSDVCQASGCGLR